MRSPDGLYTVADPTVRSVRTKTLVVVPTANTVGPISPEPNTLNHSVYSIPRGST